MSNSNLSADLSTVALAEVEALAKADWDWQHWNWQHFHIGNISILATLELATFAHWQHSLHLRLDADGIGLDGLVLVVALVVGDLLGLGDDRDAARDTRRAASAPLLSGRVLFGFHRIWRRGKGARNSVRTPVFIGL